MLSMESLAMTRAGKTLHGIQSIGIRPGQLTKPLHGHIGHECMLLQQCIGATVSMQHDNILPECTRDAGLISDLLQCILLGFSLRTKFKQTQNSVV